MIATCPHCQSGFYIVPDLAGQVITCSKCKKQVRAPDRRGIITPAHNDGIPMALLAETRAEIEERLKLEGEARIEAEKKLNDATETRIKAEQLVQELSQGKAQLEAALKETVAAKQDLIERLNTAGNAQTDDEKSALIKTEIAAREKTEENLRDAELKAATLEEKLKIETQKLMRAEEKLDAEKSVHAEVQERLKTEQQAHSQTEEKLRTEISARATAEAEAAAEAKLRAGLERRLEAQTKAKDELEEQIRIELQARTKTEAQVKTETMARMRVQSQVEADAGKLAKLEQELANAKTKLTDTHHTIIRKGSMNLDKGLLRMAAVLSIAAGVGGALFALHNGYIINSHFDRPMILPFFKQPRLLPLNLIGITFASFALVWVGYLLVKFILRGFGGNVTAKAKKLPKVEISTPAPEEAVAFGSSRIWRSS
jgi:predicted Zn finger-like uncharacterized protein